MKIPRNAHEPTPLGLSADQIQKLALAFAKVTGFTPGAPCANLVKKMGGRIHGLMTNDIVDEDADVLIAYGKSDFIARIKDPFSAGSPTMNFELGIILGYLTLFLPGVKAAHGTDAAMVVPYFAKSERQKAYHAEAVQFAADLLAPEEEFLDRWHRYAGDVTAVSQALGLPPKIIPRMLRAYNAPAH
jgi:hypothetical protein